MTTCGKTTRFNSVEVTVGSCSISHGYCHTVRIWLAGFDELGIQTRAAIPGGNSFLQFGDPISRYISSLKGNDHFTSPLPFPWNLVISRILVL